MISRGARGGGVDRLDRSMAVTPTHKTQPVGPAPPTGGPV